MVMCGSALSRSASAIPTVHRAGSGRAASIPAAIRRSMLAAFSAISRRIENATALRTAIQVDGLTRSWVKDRVGEGCTGHTKAAWLLSGLRQSLFVVRHGSLRSEAKFIPVKSRKNSWLKRNLSCCASDGAKLDLEAELGDLGGQTLGFDLGGAALEVVGAEILVVLCQEGARASCCARDEGCGPFGAIL